MNKETYERVEMLKKKAAEELHAMWDAQLKGGKEEVNWHWDLFVKLMAEVKEMEYRP